MLAGALVVTSMGSLSREAAAQSGLPVIYLPLDSRVSALGTRHVTPELQGGAPTFEAGVIGRAMRLGAESTTVRYSPTDSTRPTGNETVELCARRDAAAPTHITNVLLSFDAFSLSADVNGTDPDRNTIVAGVRTPRGYVRLTGTKPLSRLHWTHIALVVDSARHEARLYVDGVLSGTASGVDPIQPLARSPLTLGGERASDAFMGWLDDVRVFDYVRSPKTITEDARVAAATGADAAIVADVPAGADTIPYKVVFDVQDPSVAQGRQRGMLCSCCCLAPSCSWWDSSAHGESTLAGPSYPCSASCSSLRWPCRRGCAATERSARCRTLFAREISPRWRGASRSSRHRGPAEGTPGTTSSPSWCIAASGSTTTTTPTEITRRAFIRPPAGMAR